MKLPSEERSPQSFVDERHASREYSKYEELHKSREGYTCPELFKSAELPEPKRQTPSSKKRAEQEKNVRVLSQYVAGVTAATVVIGTAVLAPPAETPPPPVFSISEQLVGLHGFQCTVEGENTEGLTLTAVLTLGDELIAELPLPDDGMLAYEELAPDTEYTLRLQDERQTELFTYTVTTDPFLTLTDEGNGTQRITLHEDVPMGADNVFFLYDDEGKSFRDNIYWATLDDGSGGEETLPELTYYLFEGGLYTGEYTLQFITYPPDTEGGITYETQLSLGELTPLDYTPTVDSEAGAIALTYNAGELGIYGALSAELDGERYYSISTDELVLEDDGSVRIPLSRDWAAGAYTLYLIGNYQQDELYLYNQIFQCELDIPDTGPSFSIEEESAGLTDYQGVLQTRFTDGLTLETALLTPEGEVFSQAPLATDGIIAYTGLSPDTEYTLLVQDETQTALFSHTFKTEPFLTFTDAGNGSRLITLHEAISAGTDNSFELYDSEGKAFRDSIYSVMIDDGRGDLGGGEASDTSELNPTFAYYLYEGGLYAGEYTLRLTVYPPDGENGTTYETQLTLGNLTPLDYTPTVDSEGGTITLTYNEGELGPYVDLCVEVYQGESFISYVDTADLVFDDDGSIRISISADWTASAYTFYLMGNYQEGEIYLYNQIYKCEITI